MYVSFSSFIVSLPLLEACILRKLRKFWLNDVVRGCDLFFFPLFLLTWITHCTLLGACYCVLRCIILIVIKNLIASTGWLGVVDALSAILAQNHRQHLYY